MNRSDPQRPGVAARRPRRGHAGTAGVAEVDAEGGSVLPGFQDSHVHPFDRGLRQIGCNLEDAENGRDVLETIAQYALANPDREWITGVRR